MDFRILSHRSIAVVAGAAMLAASSVSSPAFTLSAPSRERPVAAAGVEPVQWRRGWHGGWHGGHVGFRFGFYGGPYAAEPYYDDDYYGPPVVYGAPGPAGGDVAYCMQRFRSYDPNSGTYLGFDGQRHPCP